MKTDSNWNNLQWNSFYYQVMHLLTHEKTVEVNFTKKNGEKRIMRCTLHPEVLPEVTTVNESKKSRSTALPENKASVAVPVYDVDLEAWRSFTINSVIEIVRQT